MARISQAIERLDTPTGLGCVNTLENKRKLFEQTVQPGKIILFDDTEGSPLALIVNSDDRHIRVNLSRDEAAALFRQLADAIVR